MNGGLLACIFAAVFCLVAASSVWITHKLLEAKFLAERAEDAQYATLQRLREAEGRLRAVEAKAKGKPDVFAVPDTDGPEEPLEHEYGAVAAIMQEIHDIMEADR